MEQIDKVEESVASLEQAAYRLDAYSKRLGELHSRVNKHLMTGPKGNSEFCFPETLNVPRGKAEGNIEVEGKQNLLFPEGKVIKCFVIPPNSKIERKLRNNDLYER